MDLSPSTCQSWFYTKHPKTPFVSWREREEEVECGCWKGVEVGLLVSVSFFMALHKQQGFEIFAGSLS